MLMLCYKILNVQNRNKFTLSLELLFTFHTCLAYSKFSCSSEQLCLFTWKAVVSKFDKLCLYGLFRNLL